MKKIPAAIVLSFVVLSLSLLVAGQANSNSLDDQFVQAAGSGDSATVQGDK
jgi:hypothetical protein